MDDAGLCRIRRSFRQISLFVRQALRSRVTLYHKVQRLLKSLVGTKDMRQRYIAWIDSVYVYVTLGVHIRASASNKLCSVNTYGSLVGRRVFVYTLTRLTFVACYLKQNKYKEIYIGHCSSNIRHNRPTKPLINTVCEHLPSL